MPDTPSPVSGSTTVPPACGSELLGLFDHQLRCELAPGHDGPHRDGETTWRLDTSECVSAARRMGRIDPFIGYTTATTW